MDGVWQYSLFASESGSVFLCRGKGAICSAGSGEERDDAK